MNTLSTTSSTAPRSAPTTTTPCSCTPGSPCRPGRKGDCQMKKLLAAQLAAFAVTLAGSASAADLAVKAPAPVAAPFNWTGCYIGVHVGAGFAKKDITDPVQLVQDSFNGLSSTVGVTTVSPSPSGAVLGGQGGCDYQFASSSIVIGIQGDAA